MASCGVSILGVSAGLRDPRPRYSGDDLNVERRPFPLEVRDWRERISSMTSKASASSTSLSISSTSATTST